MVDSAVDENASTSTSLCLWKGRLVAACVGLLLSLGYLWQALQLPFGTESRPGAALFPVAVGTAFALISALTAAEALRMRHEEVTFELPRGPVLRKLLLVVAALVGLLVLLPVLGLLPSGAAFSVVALRILGARSWPRAALYGCALGATVYLVFAVLLEVSFPSLTGL